jgi:hypothetical protein
MTKRKRNRGVAAPVLVTARVQTLIDMLGYCRPAGSKTESAFIRRYIESIAGATMDPSGNFHVWVGVSAVVWSCHTDTVHRTEGYQRVRVDRERITLDRGSKSSCLGADDTVGVWLCTEMIKAGVPGHYVFHFGEEIGGIGSADIVSQRPDLFTDARCVIALDRAGKEDVITYQTGERCCSDAFARSVAAQLPGKYVPCNTGVYTDSAEYVGIVGECTNLSVGYGRQHSPDEYADHVHAEALLVALLAFDESRLEYVRKPGEVEKRARYTFTDWRIDDKGLSDDDRKFLAYLKGKYADLGPDDIQDETAICLGCDEEFTPAVDDEQYCEDCLDVWFSRDGKRRRSNA